MSASDTIDDASDGQGDAVRRTVALVAGPVAACVVFFAVPETYVAADGTQHTLGTAGRGAAAVAIWMAIWWLTEALHISVTALLPLALFPALGIRSIEQTATPYANDLIFLFMGGFLLSLSMQRWNLHRRIALVTLRGVGTRPRRIVGGFMGVTALLSMWVSNTATAVMMVPIATSVLDLVERDDATERSGHSLGVGLLLGIAYAASIGGVGTLIGTPPNVFLASYVSEHLGREISFGRWMTVGIPFVVVFLPLAWWLLTRVLFEFQDEVIEGGEALLRDELDALGPMDRGESITMAVFASAAVAWIARGYLQELSIGGIEPFAGLTDPGIAMIAALVLFVLPADDEQYVMDWETARELPWGILILFGGGLSLAAAIDHTGVGHYLGNQVAFLDGVPDVVVVLVLACVVVALTELTSNTATTATFLPILAGVAPALDIEPLMLLVPAAVAASCAFMMPVATPPNAIIFGAGRITVADMRRAGVWLNLLAIALTTTLAYTLVGVALT